MRIEDIKATSDHVYVVMPQPPEQTEGGIVIPADMREVHARGLHGNGDGYATGTVVAVGPGEVNKRGRRVPVGVEVGQTIAFEPMAGYELETEDGLVQVLDSHNVLWVEEAEEAAE